MAELKPSGRCRRCAGQTFVGDRGLCAACRTADAKKAERSAKAHGKRLSDIYGITPDEYAALLDAQGGVCAICGRAPGRKRLAVDHDHGMEKAGVPVRLTVRGLLCRNCNFHIMGQLKNDPAAFRRGAQYLELPPAREVLR